MWVQPFATSTLNKKGSNQMEDFPGKSSVMKEHDSLETEDIPARGAKDLDMST